MRGPRQPWRTAPAAALALATAACASGATYLWVEDVPERQRSTGAESRAEYRVAAGDVLAVRVWNQESMSTDHARVRDDGKVTLPFLQDVEAVGMTLSELSSRLAVKLKTYVVNPVVTVTLEERRPLRIPVVGEVVRAGTYDLQQDATVLEALAAAGGLTQWASRDGIYVLRYEYWADGRANPARIRFRYDRLAGGVAPAAIFRLRAGDVLVVE